MSADFPFHNCYSSSVAETYISAITKFTWQLNTESQMILDVIYLTRATRSGVGLTRRKLFIAVVITQFGRPKEAPWHMGTILKRSSLDPHRITRFAQIFSANQFSPTTVNCSWPEMTFKEERRLISSDKTSHSTSLITWEIFSNTLLIMS